MIKLRLARWWSQSRAARFNNCTQSWDFWGIGKTHVFSDFRSNRVGETPAAPTLASVNCAPCGRGPEEQARVVLLKLQMRIPGATEGRGGGVLPPSAFSALLQAAMALGG